MKTYLVFDVGGSAIKYTLIQEEFQKIVGRLDFDVHPPRIVVCHFRNDANLIGALYQHLTDVA